MYEVATLKRSQILPVASWFISPALSGTVSAGLYWLVRRLILRAPQPLTVGLRALPFFYGATVAINVLSVVHDGPKCKLRRRRKCLREDTFSIALLGGAGAIAVILHYADLRGHSELTNNAHSMYHRARTRRCFLSAHCCIRDRGPTPHSN